MRTALLIATLLAGCAIDDPTLGEHAASALGSSAITVLDGAVWTRPVGCPSPDPSTCLREARFWVDLRIRNDAYDKQVGIVWIDQVREPADGAWHAAAATYEGTDDDGSEVWGVDVATGVLGGNEPNPQIRLAAFVEMAGTTSWDNNGGADHVLR